MKCFKSQNDAGPGTAETPPGCVDRNTRSRDDRGPSPSTAMIVEAYGKLSSGGEGRLTRGYNQTSANKSHDESPVHTITLARARITSHDEPQRRQQWQRRRHHAQPTAGWARFPQFGHACRGDRSPDDPFSEQQRRRWRWRRQSRDSRHKGHRWGSHHDADRRGDPERGVLPPPPSLPPGLRLPGPWGGPGLVRAASFRRRRAAARRGLRLRDHVGPAALAADPAGRLALRRHAPEEPRLAVGVPAAAAVRRAAGARPQGARPPGAERSLAGPAPPPRHRRRPGRPQRARLPRHRRPLARGGGPDAVGAALRPPGRPRGRGAGRGGRARRPRAAVRVRLLRGELSGAGEPQPDALSGEPAGGIPAAGRWRRPEPDDGPALERRGKQTCQCVCSLRKNACVRQHLFIP